MPHHNSTNGVLTTSQALTRPPTVLTVAAGALLGTCMTLLLRRYLGINHDSVVYLGQALLKRAPAIYGQDLFFVHGGSQDQYTLFPWLASHALDWLDPPTLFLLSALFCLIAFAIAGWYCLKALLPPNQRYWAWLGLICLPTVYGRTVMFSYSEQFFTTRPLAELLCLFAIGLLARSKWFMAAACLALAALFHPLQALAVCVVAWIWAVIRDRRWMHAAWLGVPVLALSFAGVAPFSKLLQRADAAWLAILQDNNPQLYVTRWTSGDFKILIMDILLLGYAAWALDRRFGLWCRAALAGVVIGVTANIILVDTFHLVLPAALQTWRVHWIAHWFAMAAVAALVYRDLHDGAGSRMMILMLATLLAWGDGTWAWLLLAALYVAWPRFDGPSHARMRMVLMWLCGTAVLIALANYVYTELTQFRVARFQLEFYPFDRRLLVFPVIGLGLPLLGVLLWRNLQQTGRQLLFWCLLCPLTLIAALRWDARPPQVLTLERTKPDHALFGVPIPADAQVLWGTDMVLGTWLVLERPSYFSPHQLSGQVFNRDMAVDGRSRLNRLYPLLREYRACEDPSRPSEERARCQISTPAMQQACNPGGPDYLALPFLQAVPAIGEWTAVDPDNQRVLEVWRLYRCTDVISNQGSTTGTATR